MAHVIPEPGKLEETARTLLTLAGDVPEIVRTTSGGNVFDVPDALADAYSEYMTAKQGPSKGAPRRGKKE